MTTLILDPKALQVLAVQITDDTLVVELADGRTVSVPLVWYPRLFHASCAERKDWRPVAGGEGIHWPMLDEDISVGGLLAGKPSGESLRSLRRWLDARAEPTVVMGLDE